MTELIGSLFHSEVVFVVAWQPVTILSALLCVVCITVLFAFERMEHWAGKA